MGLTKEVREFFTGRINRLLNTKLEEIYDKIDRKAVRAQAVTRLLMDIGVSVTILSRYNQIEAERSRLYDEEQEIKNLFFSSLEKAYPKNNAYRFANDFPQEVESFAVRKFEDKILGEVHPELVVEINKINHIKEDVSSVVLLSTSETKLIQRLTAVLNKYGGDISELLDYVPD